MLVEHLLPAGHQAKGFTHLSKDRRGHATITNDPSSSLGTITRFDCSFILHSHWLQLCFMVSSPESRQREHPLSGAVPVSWPGERKTWKTVPRSDTRPFAHNSLAKAHEMSSGV